MIEFPSDPAPNGAEARPIDNGFTQRGPAGPAGRVDRPGNHWAMDITFPPMKPDTARKFTSRMTWAMSENLRIEVPLLGLKQGAPGSPVVGGAGQTGTTLNVRGLNPGYVVKEGYWLHIEDAGGQRCLHQVRTAVAADATGLAALTIWPALRLPFADGDAVNLSKPTIEGAVEDFGGWSLAIDRLIRFGGSITIEEVA